ncbi:GtrA family protein [Cognaticolwellia aestuarii]|uniref:GtrA family protein n=2 Tax=Cognaticolwellia aestuarii TaxID=329993 RepID=UPI0009847C02
MAVGLQAAFFSPKIYVATLKPMRSKKSQYQVTLCRHCSQYTYLNLMMTVAMQVFKKFCFIGGIGFAIDSVVFSLLVMVTDNIILSRLVAFWLAASVTWLGNRLYTYRHQQSNSILYQWYKHMLSAHFSGAINLLVFFGVKDYISLPIAFCLGIILGLFSNYFLANRFVFVSNFK